MSTTRDHVYYPYWYAADLPEDYGGYVYGDDYYNYCNHEWVNVSFNHVTLACKFCGQDKPEDKKDVTK